MDAGRHSVQWKRAHLVHEFKDCLEFMGEAFLLLLGEAEAGEPGNPLDVEPRHERAL